MEYNKRKKEKIQNVKMNTRNFINQNKILPQYNKIQFHVMEYNKRQK